ncbi:MAG: hypothetical protein LUH14_12845 [Clostridiaceae bacterium]|nr:hypothetical protein [Clostridiaceae bacterium]
MKNLLENYDLLFAMTILSAAAILLKCICAIIYQVILRDSEQITTTKNKWIRSMITRFEACYKLKLPINNPARFVENALEHYHFLGMSIRSFENADIFCGLILIETTLLSIMGSIYYNFSAQWIAIHAITLALYLLLLCVGEFLFQVRRKRKRLQLQLVNYFENTLQPKLENQYLHPEERTAYQNEYFEENHAPKQAAPTAMTQGITEDMQELIDSLMAESKITQQIEEKKEQLNTAATNEKMRLVEEIMREYL